MNKPLDLTKPVQTRSGDSARIICTDAADRVYPVVTLVKLAGSEVVYRHTRGGAFYSSDPRPDANDLVNVSEKYTRVGWINCYKDGSNCFHEEKVNADRQRGKHCLACVPVTLIFNEGDGL